MLKRIDNLLKGLRTLFFMLAFIFGYFGLTSIPQYCILAMIIAFVVGLCAGVEKDTSGPAMSDSALQNLMMFNMMSRMNRNDDHCNPHHSYSDCHDKSHHYQNDHGHHNHH